MPFASPDKATLLQQVGSAVAVLVEGEEVGGDAWIYGDKWFGARSLEVRFLPQGRWGGVVEAVARLRREPPPHPVFGIIDRDCTPDGELADLEPQGIFRVPRYSVENYLLDPHCWWQVFRIMTDHRGGLPPTWASATEVAAKIERCYQECVDLAAFNRVVGLTKRSNPDYPDTPIYMRNPRDSRDPEGVLASWQHRCGQPSCLSTEFQLEKQRLRAAANPELDRCIDGKLVIEALLRRFNNEVNPQPQASRGPYLSYYLDKCPHPPEEVCALLDRILAEVQ